MLNEAPVYSTVPWALQVVVESPGWYINSSS